MSLYYEMHVTIEYPDRGLGVRAAEDAANALGWRMGDLLLRRDTPTRSRKDLFFTARAETRERAMEMIREICAALRVRGHNVLRYKLEDTLVDSRIEDTLSLVVVQ